MQVEAATPDRFDAIHEVLVESFGAGLAKEDWRRIVDYDFDDGTRDRGWVLVDKAKIVGFLGGIYSRRGDDAFCNLTAWAVKKSHRSASLELLLPMLELRDHTLLNLSPSPFTLAVFRRMGFADLEDRLTVIPPIVPTYAPSGYELLRDRDSMRQVLSGDDLRIFEHHAGYACTHLVFAGPRDYSYVVASKTRLRRFSTSYIYYRSNPELFRSLLNPMQRALARLHRTAFSVIDARLTEDAPLRGCPTYRLAQQRLYRPAARSSRLRTAIDAMYTELVVLDPRRWTFNY
jgi:hypothetical protein